MSDLGDGKASGFGGMASDPDNAGAVDAMSDSGPQDQDITALPASAPMPPHMPHGPVPPHVPHMQHPVAIHIHLSPSDHKAFQGMARKKPRV
jgi:hypothetical protein